LKDARRGVRKIVDGHLTRLDAKPPGLSNQALRRTGATLAYKYTRDLRAVRDQLGTRRHSPRRPCDSFTQRGALPYLCGPTLQA